MASSPDELIINELKKLNKTMSRVADLLEFSISDELEKVLSDFFTNSRDIRVYELSDGFRSTRDIGKIVALDQKGISNLWKKWAEMEIVEPTGNLKPYKAKYTIVELVKLKKKR